jgi:hypothetical protein
MAFPVSSRTTGTLITESIWNSDIVDNLNYLKGLAGAVVVQDDLSLSTGKKFTADKIFAGPRFALHKGTVREVEITWEDDTGSNYQIDEGSGGGGGFALGGVGQSRQAVPNNANSHDYVANSAEQNNAFDTSFNASRDPYLRMEFALTGAPADLSIFMGFRTTRNGTSPPLAAAESFAGLRFNGSIWVFQQANGSGGTVSTSTLTVATGRRHTIEILIVGGTGVEYYLDGVYVNTLATNLPSGDLDWQSLLISSGAGAATTTYLTLGKLIAQEDLI